MRSPSWSLRRAVAWGNAPLVELLIKGGADVNLKPTDRRVFPPLQLARQGQMADIVQLLTKAGARN